MISNDIAKQLHDRSTRGETLSPVEQKQLEEWYANEDAAESKTLSLAASEKKMSSLQAQIDAALAQLTTVAKRIQEVASENESLRHEIAALRRQLMQRLGTQPA